MSTQELKEQIAQTIRTYHTKGWSPATSTNYSFRDEENTIWVSRSGVDKAHFQATDFITVDMHGQATGQFAQIKPSAETLIHCILYQLFPDTKVILHSHSVYPVALSANAMHHVKFSGFEVQKGFAGETTHDTHVAIPVFDNTQDMSAFSDTLQTHSELLKHHCFIMRKHGTYAWGKNLFEAKRHLETLEYLCEAQYRIQTLNY